MHYLEFFYIIKELINDRIKHYIETNFNDETCAFIKTLTIGDASLLDKTNINKIKTILFSPTIVYL